MITICPKCALTLTVSAADLRVAQGQVRCGRCLAVFNALLALYDEPPGRKPSSRADRQERASSTAARGERLESSDITAPPPAAEPEPAPAEAEVAQAPLTPAPEIASELASPAVPEEVPSEIIARDIIAAGFVEETAAATDDTGVNPALSEAIEQEPALQDPAATDVNIESAAELADSEVAAPADSMPEAANEELIEDLPAANDPFIEDPGAAANDAQNPDAADDAAATTAIAGAAAQVQPELRADIEAQDAPPAPAPEPLATTIIAAPPPQDDAAFVEQEPAGIDLSEPDEDFGTVRVIVPAAVAAEAAAPDPADSLVNEADAVEPLFQRRAARDLDAVQELELVESPPAPDSAALQEELAAPPPPRRKALWAAGVVACALLIGVQLVHIKRVALAESASVGPTVRALYARLGMPIAPHWDVSAYDVRQQGAVGAADATAPLTVRASIVNRAAGEQPLPLLRVTLQDRFGNRIALRDLKPNEYLPGASGGRKDSKSPTSLAPGQRIDAEVAMADPGGKAVGFEIDACLQVAPGRFACANDQAIDHGTTSAAR